MIVTQTMVIAFIVGVLFVLNVMAIHIAIRSELHDSRQKLFQCTLVFFLPFVGAVLVYLVSRDPYRKVHRLDRSGSGANEDRPFGDGPTDGYGNFGGGDH